MLENAGVETIFELAVEIRLIVRFQETWQRNPSGTHNARDVDSSNGKVLRVALRKFLTINAENCSTSQLHAIAEKSELHRDVGSLVMRSTSKASAPPHQASSRTQSELPDWIKQSGVPAMTDPSATILPSFSS